MMMKNRDLFDESIDKLLLECDKEKAESYKFCKQQGWDDLIDDNMLKSVSKGAYATINGSYDGVEEGYKPYYEYLKGGNDMNKIERVIQENNEFLAKNYKFCKENKLDHIIDDKLLKAVAEGGYVNDNGTFDGIEEGYKPYYEYLKYGNKPQQEEVKEEPIMVYKSELERVNERIAKKYKKYKDEEKDYMIDERMIKAVAEGGYMHDHGINDGIQEGYKPYYDYLKEQQDYTTPYSFEYEPYLLDNNNYSITFDHEVTYNEPIQEIVYEEPIEEDVDSDDIINIMDILSNKVEEVKKTIIHYISNYRPIMNQYTGDIDTILIE